MNTYPVVGFGITKDELHETFSPKVREEVEEDPDQEIDEVFTSVWTDDDGGLYLMYPRFPWEQGQAQSQEEVLKEFYTRLRKGKYFRVGYSWREFRKLPFEVKHSTFTG